MIELARQYGRYGYRKIAALLRDAGWLVSDTRVERVWRREGLKVPQKQPKRGRLWLANGSCIRLRTEHPIGIGWPILANFARWLIGLSVLLWTAARERPYGRRAADEPINLHEIFQ